MYTNHPAFNDDEGPSEFERTQYRAVIWHHESRNKDDDTAMYADVPIIACGSYHYYFVDDERLVFLLSEFLFENYDLIFNVTAKIPVHVDLATSLWILS